MLLEAKLSPMNLGDQTSRFAIEIAESEETRIQALIGTLPRLHALGILD
jgi:hypothetical protein